MKKKILVAFDVDGVIHTNDKPHQHIIDLANTLSNFKNVRIMVWSGMGKEYAQLAINRHSILKAFAASKIDKETWVCGVPQIAIDDIETFDLGIVNLIVKS